MFAAERWAGYLAIVHIIIGMPLPIIIIIGMPMDIIALPPGRLLA